ncbi:MAG TPA: hypothetical protein G4O09_06050 [Dehalococcoidia bacterium]|nr:hypothetical protein [Dehalococcoidia bacterium]
MVEEDISAEQPAERWFIDLERFLQSNRSFFALARECLCPACRQRLTATPPEIAADDLLATIGGCCSKTAGFIHGELPILESVFRLFLANRNQPLDLDEMARELNERRAVGGYRTSPQVLSRLLMNDRYYGLGRFEG